MHHALKPSLSKDDTYLSYLPLYIRLEYNLVNALFLSGATIGFGTDIETYLLSAPYNPKLCPVSYGDIQSFRPSILFGIRPWWDAMHEKLLKVIESRPQAEQDQFWFYVAKKRDVVSGVLPRLLPLVHAYEKWGHIEEVRADFFGKRIRWIGVTCSMMTAEKREFLGLVLGGPRGIMVEGWPLPHINASVIPRTAAHRKGLTNATLGSSDITFMPPQHHARTGLGRPLPSVEIKLLTGQGEKVCKRRNVYRGHVYIRGPSLPKPPESIDHVSNPPYSGDGGWIATGRVGEWDISKQSFRVVDHLLEPLTARFLGDYVPIERLEAIYKKVNYVNECVLLNSWRSVQLIGVISMCPQSTQ